MNGFIDRKEFEVIMVNTQEELSELRDSRHEELSNKSTTSLGGKSKPQNTIESEKGKVSVGKPSNGKTGSDSGKKPAAIPGTKDNAQISTTQPQ